MGKASVGQSGFDPEGGPTLAEMNPVDALLGLRSAALGMLSAIRSHCFAAPQLGAARPAMQRLAWTPARTMSTRRVEETVLGISQTAGRTVDVDGSFAQAAVRLKNIVMTNKLRDIARRNREYEKPHDKRRRKLSEKEHRYFLRVMRERVGLAHNLKRKWVTPRSLGKSPFAHVSPHRVEAAKRNYVEI